jgi:hypothetical protein
MITVESIQASRANNVEIHTLVCEFPLTILNQLLTHRAFSRNSSSARAVPVSKAIDQLLNAPAEPIWTKKGKGMSGDIITNEAQVQVLNAVHEHYMICATSAANTMDTLGVHKQNAGRYLTPFQNCRIVLTSTDWANWDWLRVDEAAQPEIQELATKIAEARANAEIMDLEADEYHVPFIRRHRAVNGDLEYFVTTEEGHQQVCLEHAIKVSMSACAQTSYRKLDTSLEKADSIIPKLFDGAKVHASPSEHQAKVPPTGCCNLLGAAADLPLATVMANLPEGITGINTNATLQSGNFTNWIQHRQLLPNHDGGIDEHTPDLPDSTCTCDAEEHDGANAALQELIEALDSAFSASKEPEKGEYKIPTPDEFDQLPKEEQKKAMKAILKELTDTIPKVLGDSEEKE